MPWVAPKTDFVNGDVLTATQMNNIGGDLAMLNGGTTGQVLAKASATDGDFTWTSETDPNAIPKTLIDAKADLITATAADTPARLAVGTNGQVLTADSTTATGLKWAAAASGAWTELASGSLSTSSGTLSLSSIASTYRDLRLIIRNLQVGTTSNTVRLRVNSDSGSNYSYELSEANDTALTALGSNAIVMTKGSYVGSGARPNGFVIDLLDYANTSAYKTFRINGVYYDSNQAAYAAIYTFGAWNSTAAINAVELSLASGNFSAGTYQLLGGN